MQGWMYGWLVGWKNGMGVSLFVCLDKWVQVFMVCWMDGLLRARVWDASSYGGESRGVHTTVAADGVQAAILCWFTGPSEWSQMHVVDGKNVKQ